MYAGTVGITSYKYTVMSLCRYGSDVLEESGRAVIFKCQDLIKMTECCLFVCLRPATHARLVGDLYPKQTTGYEDKLEPVKLDRLTEYATLYPKKLNLICKDLEDRIKKDFKNKKCGYVVVGCAAFAGLAKQCHELDLMETLEDFITRTIILILSSNDEKFESIASVLFFSYTSSRDECDVSNLISPILQLCVRNQTLPSDCVQSIIGLKLLLRLLEVLSPRTGLLEQHLEVIIPIVYYYYKINPSNFDDSGNGCHAIANSCIFILSLCSSPTTLIHIISCFFNLFDNDEWNPIDMVVSILVTFTVTTKAHNIYQIPLYHTLISHARNIVAVSSDISNISIPSKYSPQLEVVNMQNQSGSETVIRLVSKKCTMLTSIFQCANTLIAMNRTHILNTRDTNAEPLVSSIEARQSNSVLTIERGAFASTPVSSSPTPLPTTFHQLSSFFNGDMENILCILVYLAMNINHIDDGISNMNKVNALVNYLHIKHVDLYLAQHSVVSRDRDIHLKHADNNHHHHYSTLIKQLFEYILQYVDNIVQFSISDSYALQYNYMHMIFEFIKAHKVKFHFMPKIHAIIEIYSMHVLCVLFDSFLTHNVNYQIEEKIRNTTTLQDENNNENKLTISSNPGQTVEGYTSTLGVSKSFMSVMNNSINRCVANSVNSVDVGLGVVSGSYTEAYEGGNKVLHPLGKTKFGKSVSDKDQGIAEELPLIIDVKNHLQDIVQLCILLNGTNEVLHNLSSILIQQLLHNERYYVSNTYGLELGIAAIQNGGDAEPSSRLNSTPTYMTEKKKSQSYVISTQQQRMDQIHYFTHVSDVNANYLLKPFGNKKESPIPSYLKYRVLMFHDSIFYNLCTSPTNEFYANRILSCWSIQESLLQSYGIYAVSMVLPMILAIEDFYLTYPLQDMKSVTTMMSLLYSLEMINAQICYIVCFLTYLEKYFHCIQLGVTISTLVKQQNTILSSYKVLKLYYNTNALKNNTKTHNTNLVVLSKSNSLDIEPSDQDASSFSNVNTTNESKKGFDENQSSKNALNTMLNSLSLDLEAFSRQDMLLAFAQCSAFQSQIGDIRQAFSSDLFRPSDDPEHHYHQYLSLTDESGSLQQMGGSHTAISPQPSSVATQRNIVLASWGGDGSHEYEKANAKQKSSFGSFSIERDPMMHPTSQWINKCSFLFSNSTSNVGKKPFRGGNVTNNSINSYSQIDTKEMNGGDGVGQFRVGEDSNAEKSHLRRKTLLQDMEGLTLPDISRSSDNSVSMVDLEFSTNRSSLG